jgi:pSer/pThr/pTyr-binding forkhead associated (FHA) protein
VAAVSQVPQYALRFISGKYQGGEFPLRMDREIVIGRSSDLDMVLVEDMVSRKHAKISTAGGQITIQDLGSTNGTFVNGEKIKKVRLKEGDRILIGTSIIKLVSVEGSGSAQLTEAEARSRMDQSAQRRPSGPGRPMSGSIEEIPLPDLLQLLSTSRKSGVLSIRGESGLGKIYLRKGQIYYASIDDSFDLAPRKAVYRLLTWQSGTFELEPPDERDVLEEIKESTEALLMEGVRQLDELRRIEAELPPRGTMLAMIHPLQPALRELSPAEIDVFQTVLNYGTLQAVLDKSTLTDLETAQSILSLMQRGYVAVTE